MSTKVIKSWPMACYAMVVGIGATVFIWNIYGWKLALLVNCCIYANNIELKNLKDQA